MFIPTIIGIWLLISFLSFVTLPISAPTTSVAIEDSHTSSNSVKLGETLTIYYDINNPTSQNFTVWLGATLRHSSTGTIIHNPSNDKLVTVDPGRSVQERSFRMPLSAPTGSYDYIVAIWDAKPPNGNQFYKSNWAMNAFSVKPTAIPSYDLVIDGNELLIPWSMETGKVSHIEVDKQSKSVAIVLERSELKEDNLLITLPKKLINTNGTEAEFTVAVNNREAHYEETHRGTEVRELSIPLTSDATGVQIFGTYIIPEFPIAPLAVMGTIIAATIVISRFKQR